MEVLKRLVYLGKYLTGGLIVIDVDNNFIDAGTVNQEHQRKAAIEFFHQTYTKRST